MVGHFTLVLMMDYLYAKNELNTFDSLREIAIAQTQTFLYPLLYAYAEGSPHL